MENKKRLIYADEAKSQLTGWETDPTDEEIAYTIDYIPTIDAVEVVHGRWIVDRERMCAECSECGKGLNFTDEMQIELLKRNERYCYYCGAKMDGDGDV